MFPENRLCRKYKSTMSPENRLCRKHKQIIIFITAIYVNDMFMYSVIYALPNDTNF